MGVSQAHPLMVSDPIDAKEKSQKIREIFPDSDGTPKSEIVILRQEINSDYSEFSQLYFVC